MNSPRDTGTSNPDATRIFLNRRSLLKGSASLAAGAAVASTFGPSSAIAEGRISNSPSAGAMHPLEDFPGGI